MPRAGGTIWCSRQRAGTDDPDSTSWWSENNVQRDPFPTFDQQLVDRVIDYCQTRNPALFPFTARFDEDRENAFVRDLRDGLADLSDSGAKRGTSSTGFLMKDWRLLQIVAEWEQARGNWPRGYDPGVAFTSLGVSEDRKAAALEGV